MSHHLAAGMIVMNNNNEILLVRDKDGWSLPKGSLEKGEVFKETAERELLEETGITLEGIDVAFMIEFTTEKYGQYLQVYYYTDILDKMEVKPQDPDSDIIDIKFVHVSQIRKYITFRAWVIPLGDWLKKQECKFYSFHLDKEGFEIN